MTRDAFRNQLQTMNRELLVMGEMVQHSIREAVGALVTRDLNAAAAVIANDKKINEAYFKIERLCLELLALQQPMAGDLRRIASTLKVITDLERMADHAVDIARVVERIGEQRLVKRLVDIPQMATLVQEMIAIALSAFVDQDMQRALVLTEKDHHVDRLHRQVIKETQALMEQDGTTVAQGVQLLFASNALERIGDHATNLGEWFIYMETGERTDLNQ